MIKKAISGGRRGILVWSVLTLLLTGVWIGIIRPSKSPVDQEESGSIASPYSQLLALSFEPDAIKGVLSSNIEPASLSNGLTSVDIDSQAIDVNSNVASKSRLLTILEQDVNKVYRKDKIKAENLRLHQSMLKVSPAVSK